MPRQANKAMRAGGTGLFRPLVVLLLGALVSTGCGSPAEKGTANAKPPAKLPAKVPTKPPATVAPLRQSQSQAQSQAKPPANVASPAQPAAVAPQPNPPAQPAPPAQAANGERPAQAVPVRTLADLAAAAEAQRFILPEHDAAQLQAAGIRQLVGKHITLYTDLPSDPTVDELPTVFDAAVPQFCEFCGVDPARAAAWHIVGYLMQAKERFQAAGIYPDNLPPFPHGYSRGSEIWLFDQPSAYYRRHLMIHEGTHAFMERMLGGAGPPWYMEGTAELLGTHRWLAGKLTLAYMPQTKEEAPYWGRVKIVRDEFAANRGMRLTDIMKYDAHAHLKNEPYGWCWAAAQFFDAHPLTQAKFRELPHAAKDRSIDFSKRFYDSLQPHWPAIRQDWQLFVANMDYGYDIARAAVVHRPAAPLPPAGASVTVATDRGWQSTGLKLQAGQTYQLVASGRYNVASQPVVWPCEAGGITLHYHQGLPLGMLLAAVGDLQPGTPQPGSEMSPLVRPVAIGLAGEITPTATGTLYLRINESAASLADNAGELSVQVRAK